MHIFHISIFPAFLCIYIFLYFSVFLHIATYIFPAFLYFHVSTFFYFPPCETKIVCNFEAGEVSKSNGSHLFEYVQCPNKHLEQSFDNPDVLARGVTRIEVFILGFEHRKDYSNVLENEFRLFDGVPIFHIQPGTRQWKNLASEVKKTLVIADRTHGDIYYVCYGNSETKKIAGVGFTCPEKVRTTPKEWENAIQWFVSSFGFHHLPIFCFSFETNQNEEGKKSVSISPLRCYLKEGPTYLVPCNKPNAVVSKKTLPSEKLTDTENIRWI